MAAQPLSARSVIASTLLPLRDPAMPPSMLVRAGEAFGISEGTTRVALSRMTRAGELVTDDGTYRLAGHLLERRARQSYSRRPATFRWNGEWWTAVVRAPARPPAERSALRRAMRELRFGELRDGVWMRPDNISLDTTPEALAAGRRQCRWLVSRAPEGGARELAGELWDIAGWARRAEDLRRNLRRGAEHLGRGGVSALREGFVLAAAVLRHLQADPLLPPELLPGGWPGGDLRESYGDYESAFGRRWSAWLSSRE